MIEPGEGETESGSASATTTATGPSSSSDPTAEVDTGHEGSTSTGDEEASGSDSTGELPAGLCGRTAAQNVAVVARGTDLSLLRGDETEIPLDLQLVGLPKDTYVEVRAVHDENLVAVAVEWTIVDNGIEYGGVLATYERDGTPRWTHVEDHAGLSGPALGAEGSVVVTSYDGAGQTEGLLFDADSTMHIVDDFRPMGGLRPDGLVPGYYGQTPAWADPLDESIHPVVGTVSGAAYFTTDGEIVYVDGGALIRESPDDVAAFIIGGDGEDTVIAAFADPWALLRTGVEFRFVRVDTSGGEPEDVELVLPRGSEPFGCQFVNPSIDRTGGVLYPVRDPFSAGVQRFDPPSELTGIGLRHTNIEDMTVYPYGETYVVSAAAAGTTFCGLPEWEPNDRGLPEGGVEIVRPADDFSLLIDASTGYAAANAEGDCIVHGIYQGDLTLLDPADGADYALEGPAVVFF